MLQANRVLNAVRMLLELCRQSGTPAVRDPAAEHAHFASLAEPPRQPQANFLAEQNKERCISRQLLLLGSH